MVDNYGLKENTMFIYASDHGLSGKWSLKEQDYECHLLLGGLEKLSQTLHLKHC